MRLTKTTKKKIKQEILKLTFSKRESEIKELLYFLADDLYAELYDKATVKIIKNLPSGWLCENKSIYVSLNGQYRVITMRESKRFLAKDTLHRVLLLLDSNHPLSKRHNAIMVKEKNLREETENLSREIDSILESCTTVNKLITLWPEIEKYVNIPKEIRPENQLIPNVRAVNTTICKNIKC